MKQRIAEAMKNGEEKPLEVRILQVTNDAKVYLTFSKEMNFPANFTEMLNARQPVDTN